MERRESTAELASGLVEKVEHLVQLEVDLAKQELKELAVRNGIAAGLFAAALLLVVLAVFVALPVLIVMLVPLHWLAALVWLVLYVVLAAACGVAGRAMLRIKPPEKTIESLQETKTWALQQIKSPGR
jgi:putative superfamily III holin-X